MSAYHVFPLVLALVIASCPSFSEPIPETLMLTVYADGFVFVDYKLLVDPTSPTQNVTMFGQILEELVITNRDGLPLGYSINNSTFTVDSLGTDEIIITYLTQDLTSKDGRYWTLTIDPPMNTHIILATGASITSLNKVPEMIETNDNIVALIMGAGYIEITYVIGIVGTEEHAQIVLENAEQTIESIKDLGIILTQAEAKLRDAEEAFDLENYPEAEVLGDEARILALQTNQTATQAQQKIEEAEEAIAEAENQERTLGLDDAQEMLSQAKGAYATGDYSGALNLAIQAISQAVGADSSSGTQPLLLFYGILSAVVVLIVVFGFFVRSRNKLEQVEVAKSTRQIDIKRIFRIHKNLIPEEKQAIQFLAEHNGEAFEADLYEYVKLPRTTTWRMVKRLEGMGIIKTTKFRRQNLVRIRTKYDIKK